ncbi:hypothetical protein [Caballeronia sp. S22]|uniref:hypothetical protein n=1 Tax=Caballeronia sp. S22 TaxID=3137182 RepID=UPI003530CB3D
MRISIITFQETFGKKDLSRAGFFSDYRDVGATKKSVKMRGLGFARWTVEARGTGFGAKMRAGERGGGFNPQRLRTKSGGLLFYRARTQRQNPATPDVTSA